MLNRKIIEFETTYAEAKAANDDKSANAAKKQLDQLIMRHDRRRDELRPKIVEHLRHEIVQGQGKSISAN